MKIEKEKLVWMYRTIERHREFENTVLKEFAAGNIPGFVHLGQGEEAVSVGAMAALRPDDSFTSTHRAHGHLVARGEKTERMMAEIFGRKTGMMKGKGGSMHFANLDFGDLGVTGLLGVQCVIAPGAALAAKLKGTDQVTLCFLGDGSLNTGPFHEGMNLAAAWKLPVVFICINNIWAESTNIYDVTNLTNLTDRAIGYGVPSISADGNDVFAVYEAVTEAIARARKGGGPTFIEFKSCRWRGHFEGDTQTYRKEGEVDECKKKDPIPRFRKKLTEMGVLTEKEADEINQAMLKELDDAVKFAEESPLPDPEEALEDVFA